MGTVTDVRKINEYQSEARKMHGERAIRIRLMLAGRDGAAGRNKVGSWHAITFSGVPW